MQSFLSLILFLAPMLICAQELTVYNLMGYDRDNGETVGFVALTDAFPWSDNQDSLVISHENLGNQSFSHDNYHELSKQLRKRFLSRLNINESDQLFLYNPHLDSIIVFNVKNLKLTAFLTPYGADLPIRPFEYFIGFELEATVLELSDYYNSYICFGAKNPFQREKMKPVVWLKVEDYFFPTTMSVDSNLLIDSEIESTYYYYENELKYFIQNRVINQALIARHFIVVNAENNTIVFNKTYWNGDGAYLLPLAIDEGQEGIESSQWSGELFKDKPTVITDFLEYSFGCPSLIFLNSATSEIKIRCDNRH